MENEILENRKNVFFKKSELHFRFFIIVLELLVLIKKLKHFNKSMVAISCILGVLVVLDEYFSKSNWVVLNTGCTHHILYIYDLCMYVCMYVCTIKIRKCYITLIYQLLISQNQNY